MIKELQTNPLSGAYLHIDFYEIDMQRKIKVSVPVVTQGKSEGVEEGGLLQIVRREIELLCLPTAIPESIEVDISAICFMRVNKRSKKKGNFLNVFVQEMKNPPFTDAQAVKGRKLLTQP